MKILIVDDEPLLKRILEKRVRDTLPNAECFAFTDPTDAAELAETTPIDIAFLDIDMPVLSGIELAKGLQERYPGVNIIFCTGYSEYMPEAWKLYSSGYLLKPITKQDIEEAVKNLRHPIVEPPKVTFHCFGNFEIYYNGTPVSFQYQRTKELLAYLVDRDGVDVTTKEIMAGAFEDSVSRSYFSQLRNDLLHTFEKLGDSDALRVSRSLMAVERSQVDCDLYDYLDGKTTHPPTEYMTQYSFGEYRLASFQ